MTKLMRWLPLGALVLAAGCGPLAAANDTAGAFKSGPQVGEKVPGPFEPYNVNGPSAGDEACLFCRFGNDPVAMVFARDTSGPVVALAKKLDEATVKNREARLGSCVIFCSADNTLKARLKELAGKEGIKELVLAVEKPAGPEDYKIAADADVTVLLYDHRTVKANHTFKKGELTEEKVNQVLADLGKVLPAQK
jgi:hypothetical protein